MDEIRIATTDGSPALHFAVRELEKKGVAIVQKQEQATHLLMPVPSPPMTAAELPEKVTLIGGKLEVFPPDYTKVDLLQDEHYLAENAALTADCAMRLLGKHLPVTFWNCPILVFGWGRIGKCLTKLLKGAGAQVCVAARKPSDRAMLIVLGYDTVDIPKIEPERYRAIINTAPAPAMCAAGGDGVNIDLASISGMEGENVIWARGLPGKMLPESSGKLIARSVLRHLQEGRK